MEITGDRDYSNKKSLRKKLTEKFGGSLRFVNIGSKAEILLFNSNSEKIIADYHVSATTEDGS